MLNVNLFWKVDSAYMQFTAELILVFSMTRAYYILPVGT